MYLYVHIYIFSLYIYILYILYIQCHIPEWGGTRAGSGRGAVRPISLCTMYTIYSATYPNGALLAPAPAEEPCSVAAAKAAAAAEGPGAARDHRRTGSAALPIIRTGVGGVCCGKQ